MKKTSNSLKQRIFEDIALNGPMPLSRYMNICLSDPKDGYYTSRDPLGVSGDFTTAPEISQMFGELIGIWLISAWKALGSPKKTRLVELGPGRGTLMADCLRTLSLEPKLLSGLRITMVELSPVLATKQRKRLSHAPCPIEWSPDLKPDELPTFVVGNEFFDALPIHVLVKTKDGFSERHVVQKSPDELTFEDLPSNIPNAMVHSASFANGTVFELSPQRNQMAQSIGHLIRQNDGAVLVIDYGFEQPKFGTTFQAITNHQSVDPLQYPGLADLTSLVDFTALQQAFQTCGLNSIGPISQSDFLLNLGILERAGRLGSGAKIETQKMLQQAVTRLVSPDEMGTLFHVMAASSPAINLSGFEN